MEDISIVHLCQDQKWTGGAYYLFEKAFPKKNNYIVIKPSDKSLKHITFINPLVETTIDKFNSIAAQMLENASIIVLHGLNTNHAIVASKHVIRKKILWLTMGAEIYGNPYIYNERIIGVKTEALRREIAIRFYLKEGIRQVLMSLKFGKTLSKKDGHKLIAKVAKDIDYVGAFYRGRVEMLKRLGTIKENAKFQSFSYYPLEYIVNSREDINVQGENVLLGNSASYTNNHLEAIDKLADLELGCRKIYTPLSYGNNHYANEIIKYGKRKLKHNFSPLIDFLSLSDYNKLIQSCGIVIMNHYRDQGVGNILSTLYRGSKLFMSERSAVYEYLKSIGCVVFCIEQDLDVNNKDVFKLLQLDQIDHNRSILKKEISENILVDILQKGLNEYLNNE